MNRPIAQNQWLLTIKSESDNLPDFELGNFCMLSIPQLQDPLLPRPFAIVERTADSFSFIYRVTGKQTRLLCSLQAGSRIDCMGPLGRGIPRTWFEAGEHIFVAGGVGYASVLPLMNQLSEAARTKARVFYGVRTDLEVIRRGNLSPVFASDDGSIGIKGRLPELLKKESFSPQAKFYICGPTPMMKAVYPLLPQERSYYFLEETMGCGFGICVGCVVTVNDPSSAATHRVKSCLEGPMFRGDVLNAWVGGAH